MSTIDDNAIIDRVLAGDTEAYGILIEKYQKMAFRYVYSRFNDYDEAMDITQDVFMMVFEALHTFRRESRFTTWFYSIMVNYCKNYRKKKSRTTLVPIHKNGQDEEYEIPIPDERADPEGDVINADSMRIVQEEIAGLSEDYRDILIMRDIEEMSYNEIAESLDISLSNVKVRIHRGREMLKNRLHARGLL